MKARIDMQTAIIVFLSVALIFSSSITATANTELKERAAITTVSPVQIVELEEEKADTPLGWSYNRLPDMPTNMYVCEPYTPFLTNSEQAILQNECSTDEYTGIRYKTIGEIKYYCAAMASAYGTEIGNCFTITLCCGTVIHVICADFKHPINKAAADDFGDLCQNYDGQETINILEFVVDMYKIPASVKRSGTMSALKLFGGLHGDGGDIVKIEYLGRRWKP